MWQGLSCNFVLSSAKATKKDKNIRKARPSKKKIIRTYADIMSKFFKNIDSVPGAVLLGLWGGCKVWIRDNWLRFYMKIKILFSVSFENYDGFLKYFLGLFIYLWVKILAACVYGTN